MEDTVEIITSLLRAAAAAAAAIRTFIAADAFAVIENSLCQKHRLLVTDRYEDKHRSKRDGR